MSKRRQGRECALQILYQLDMGTGELKVDELSDVLDGFWQSFTSQKPVRHFAEELVRGVLDELEAIDQIVRQASDRWRMERMAPVDRNVLRLGAYELVYRDTPAPVVINEAVELAKRFGAEQSPSFVNGILDRVYRTNSKQDVRG